MTQEPGPKKLATIMAVDLAGFSALAETDEAAAIALVERVRTEVEAAAAREGGRVFNTAGDGFMLEFTSVAGALAAAEQVCAVVECQSVRIGVHLGDVLTTPSGDLLGHGVNVAARLQQMAKPGAVLVSIDVQRAVRGALAARLRSNGAIKLNKMAEMIDTFVLHGADADPSAPPAQASHILLAVLPFDNDNDGAELDFFAEGVADEIMLTLMRQSALKVIGRTSAFQFRGKDKGRAAAALRASHVLDGAVRRSGQKLRINAQLIEAASGVAVWSARYDRKLAHAFELQDDIAREVASALRCALARGTNGLAQPPIDPAAYDLYLRAKRIWLTLSDVEEEQAAILLERCVARAPDFAPGWAALASVRAFLLPRDRDLIGSPEHNAALAAAHKALALDPDCAQAFAALSLLKPGYEAHGEKLDLVEQALQRMPNDPSLLVARAVWLYGLGYINDAIETLDAALMLEPLGAAVEGLRASLLSAHGEVEQALDVVRAAWSRWPDSPFTWYMMLVTSCVAGKLDEAEALGVAGAPPKRGVSPQDVTMLMGYVQLLRLDEAQRRAYSEANLNAIAAATTPLPVASCAVAAAMGCADRAFDVLEQAIDAKRDLRPDMFEAFGMARAQASLQLFANNGGSMLSHHPRFPALAARLGLAQHWIESGRWPDCADAVEFDFRAACAEAVAARAGA